MLNAYRTASLIASFAAGGGLMALALAQGTTNAPPVGVARPSIYTAASATHLQSFLWLFDRDAQSVTFCFSTASPETGPQYDFRCRTKSVAQAAL
jgi:hypothetical protein